MGIVLRIVAAFVVAFFVAQLIRPSRVNSPSDPSHAIGAQLANRPELAGILDRSCGDCHSNKTQWPAYASIAPLSWLMSSAVSHGRDAVNFSEWSTYPRDQQRRMLKTSCAVTSAGKMPSRAWEWLHPEAKLSAADIAAICAAAEGEGERHGDR